MDTIAKTEELDLGNREELIRKVRQLERYQFLPHMFQVRGRPYTLDDYPQFRTFYPSVYPPRMLWMCGRQLGKTINLSRSEVLDCAQIRNFQILYVAPLQSQTQRYSRVYLKDAIAGSPVASQLQEKDEALGAAGKQVVRTVGYQSFVNGSCIQLTYAKTSSDRARGITSDRIDFDEIQDQLLEHLPIIEESLTQSEWQHRRYTGTAKTTDNVIETLWKQSTMSEWGMKCTACGEWNIPNLEGRVLDMIRPEGPCCIHCHKQLPIRDGKWIHGHPDREREFTGYHIPQIVVPSIVYNPKKWGALINKVLRLPPATIFTEVLGISSDEGLKPITQADIDKVSTLGSHKDLLRTVRNYSNIVIGVDWGVAEIKSFTVAAVCGLTHSGRVNVLYAKRYHGMDYDEVTNDIAAMANTYGTEFIAGDYGVGFVHNQRLARLGKQVAQFQYVNQNRFLTYLGKPDEVEHWTLDRNSALTIVFWLIKSGQIHFARKEDSANYTQDLLSPFEQVVESIGGITRKRFARNPNLPDDFAHALTFGTVALFKASDMGADLLDIIPEGSFSGKKFAFDKPIDINDVLSGGSSMG